MTRSSRSVPALYARGLGVSRGGRRVIHQADLSLHPGELVGLVGDNGAGKTTLLAALLGVLPRSSGALERLAPIAAYAPDALALPGRGRGRDAVGYLGRMIRAQYPAHVLSPARAEHFARSALDQRIARASFGTRQIISLAATLATGAGVYLFDEPYNGLDPRHVNRLNAQLRHLRDGGAAILVSSHYVASLRTVADRIVHLQDGALHPLLAAPGDGAQRIVIESSAPAELARLLRAHGRLPYEGVEGIEVDVEHPAEVSELLRLALGAGMDIFEVRRTLSAAPVSPDRSTP